MRRAGLDDLGGSRCIDVGCAHGAVSSGTAGFDAGDCHSRSVGRNLNGVLDRTLVAASPDPLTLERGRSTFQQPLSTGRATREGCYLVANVVCDLSEGSPRQVSRATFGRIRRCPATGKLGGFALPAEEFMLLPIAELAAVDGEALATAHQVEQEPTVWVDAPAEQVGPPRLCLVGRYPAATRRILEVFGIDGNWSVCWWTNFRFAGFLEVS